MPYLSDQDINFDGQHDLHVFDNAGAIGNFWYSAWLFENKKGFVFNQAISDISAPKLDNNSKQIISYNRLGACEETIVYYNIVGEKIKPAKNIINQFGNCIPDSGCQTCMTYKEELIGNKWKVTKLGEWESELYDSIYVK
jgi:hypothetical protein